MKTIMKITITRRTSDGEGTTGWGFVLARQSDRLLLYPYVTLSVRSNPEAVVIYYILLAAIGAVSGVFAYYPHPGGQA